MEMIFNSVIFSGGLALIFAICCFCVIMANQKIEAENIELKRKLQIVQSELNLILKDYNYNENRVE